MKTATRKQNEKKKAKAGGKSRPSSDPSGNGSAPTTSSDSVMPSATATQAMPKTLMVALADIERDGSNHRLSSAQLKQAVAERAASFNRVGQLVPVRVYDRADDDGKFKSSNGHKRYLLDSGFVRCAAAELVGWELIRAEVLPMPADRATVEQTRSAENLDRLNLNAMEEVNAVTQMLEACGGDLATAAAKLGRPESWVRDRDYLRRLCPEVRKQVADGTLPLGYAREIAKLGDHDDQKFLAAEGCTRDDGRVHRSIDEIKRYVNERMRSLRIVPWKLDADFPASKRIVGPCVGCAFNTATDRNLFEHDAKPPEDGICMKGDCFEAKQEATRTAVEKVVTTIIKQDLPASEKSANEVSEDKGTAFAKPASIARAAKKQMDGDAPAGGKAAAKAAEESYEDKVRNATWKFNNARTTWGQGCQAVVMKAAAKRPGGQLAIVLSGLLPAGSWNANEKDLKKSEPALALLFDAKAFGPKLIDFEELAVKLRSTSMSPPMSLQQPESPLRDYIAHKWDLTFDAPPDQASFMPKKPEAKSEKSS